MTDVRAHAVQWVHVHTYQLEIAKYYYNVNNFTHTL